MDIARRDFDAIIRSIREEDPHVTVQKLLFFTSSFGFFTEAFRGRRSFKEPKSYFRTGTFRGIRLYALEQFGPMSLYIFNKWGIYKCSDFGSIVFNLVESQVLGKTESDSPEDFNEGYDFETAFVEPFNPENKPKYKKPRLL